MKKRSKGSKGLLTNHFRPRVAGGRFAHIYKNTGNGEKVEFAGDFILPVTCVHCLISEQP